MVDYVVIAADAVCLSSCLRSQVPHRVTRTVEHYQLSEQVSLLVRITQRYAADFPLNE